MTDFSVFVETYGELGHSERADPKLLAPYKGAVPEQLVEFWERFGFGGYANGLIWVINPGFLEDVLAQWPFPDRKKGRVIPVARTAFGNIVYWQDPKFNFLEVHHNQCFSAGGDAELLFAFYLTDKKSRESVLDESLFKKALKAFGVLANDEMYAYKLPLAMGGAPSMRNMGKAKIREYLSILSSTHRQN